MHSYTTSAAGPSPGRGAKARRSTRSYGVGSHARVSTSPRSEEPSCAPKE